MNEGVSSLPSAILSSAKTTMPGSVIAAAITA